MSNPLVISATGLLLLGLWVLAIYLDGEGTLQLEGEEWWKSVQFAVLIVYILVVGYFLDQLGNKSLAEFRPLADIDDRDFNRLVGEASGTRRGALGAIATSIAVGLLVSRPWNWDVTRPWIFLYILVTLVIFDGLVGLAIYESLTRSRLFRKLYNEPLKLDIFDLSPLRPLARESLAIAVAFIGGVTISILFNPRLEELMSVEAIFLYGTYIAVALLLFFGSMLEAHQVIIRAKERELKVVRLHLAAAYRHLTDSADRGHDEQVEPQSGAINAWLAYEKRIMETPEWPYTADTLRGLFVSVLFPVVVAVIAELLTN